MKTYNQLMTEIFGFRKKGVPISAPTKRFPDSGEANDWMSQKVSYYEKYKPDALYRLFDPSTGDYLPLDVHVGSSWKKEHQEHYRELKKKYPEAVKKARESFNKNSMISRSVVGDPEDFR